MLEIIERIFASLIILGMLLFILFLVIPDGVPIKDPSILVPPPAVDTSPLTADDLNFDKYISRLIYGWAIIMLISLLTTAFGFKNILAVPDWPELEKLLSHDAFKLSYVGLFLIPLGVYILKVNFLGLQNNFEVPLNVKISYFSALSFALATIIYTLAGPKSSNIGENSRSNLYKSKRLMFTSLCYAALMYGVLFLLIVLYRTSIYIYFS